MSTIDKQCQEFSAKRKTFLTQLGKLDENVLSRLEPRVIWPSSMLGMLQIVYRPESVLVVTDGLSDPSRQENSRGKDSRVVFSF